MNPEPGVTALVIHVGRINASIFPESADHLTKMIDGLKDARVMRLICLQVYDQIKDDFKDGWEEETFEAMTNHEYWIEVKTTSPEPIDAQTKALTPYQRYLNALNHCSEFLEITNTSSGLKKYPLLRS